MQVFVNRLISFAERTFLQRRRKPVRFSKQELLVVLRAYREHPSRWDEILGDIRENLDLFPEAAREIYRVATVKQLRERISSKLGKLIATRDAIQDDDIRYVNIFIEIQK